MLRTAAFVLIAAAAPIANAAMYQSVILFPISALSAFSSASPAGGPATAVGGQVVGSALDSAGINHAYLWASSGGGDLGAGFASGSTTSFAVATSGGRQVGYTETSGGAYTDQAILWSGPGGSSVNLNPVSLSGFTASEALGLSASEQVGYATGTAVGNQNHAVLWSGSASSAVDLQPAAALGYSSSAAVATDGTQQVGQVSGTASAQSAHAALWAGSADSFVDLNPTAAGYTTSLGLGVDLNQQVGNGSGSATNLQTHALLWTGSAGSVIDLNPTNLTTISSSTAEGTNGSQQVGFGSGNGTGNHLNALLWSGTAGSAINLQSMLPDSVTWTSSYATSIDSAGNVFGVAQGVMNAVTENFAVEWSPLVSSSLVDVANGHLDLSGSSLESVILQVNHGYNGGNWNGTSGITSSAAAADTSHLTALGIMQNDQNGSAYYTKSRPFYGSDPGASDILLKYTYYGDANLDGQVDGSDYSRIDAAVLANQQTAGSMSGWFNGDFNYDGFIDGSDYTLIDNAFNTQGNSFASVIASITSEVATPPAATSVPEANSLLAASIASVALLLGRRRLGRKKRI